MQQDTQQDHQQQQQLPLQLFTIEELPEVQTSPRKMFREFKVVVVGASGSGKTSLYHL